MTKFSKNRWQKLAGIKKEEIEISDEQTLQEGRSLGIASPGVMGNPFGTSALAEELREVDDKEYKYDNVNDWLYQYAHGGRYDPKEVAPNVREFAKKHNFDIPKMIDALKGNELDEQNKSDVSPESTFPSYEDEEDAYVQHKEDDFEERLPPEFEDDGFNVVVINDIGEELQAVEYNLQGLRKAEMLSKRLEKAVRALKDELRENEDGLFEV